MHQRSQDWRNGAVVYQILVDRFAPSRHAQDKLPLYQWPRRLRCWSELPKAGPYLEKAEVWSHEVDFWGGDLDSLRGRLDYLEKLGVSVVYLNPIFESLTNHKYDTWDYHKVDSAYGDRAQLAALCQDLHRRDMRLMLDGVFNHMGRKSPMFQEARSNPASPWRDFFHWRSATEAVGWADVDNLPELNLENEAVRRFLWEDPDSVVQSYLRQEQIDGWRLDVAFDLGPEFLQQLTQAAHAVRPDSAVIGEIWNYPQDWYPAVDAVMNMHGRALILKLCQGQLEPARAARVWETMVMDCDYDHLLKAWLVLDNHDTPRLSHILPQSWQIKMARALQFTLPGSVCLYYGSEVGMAGGDDPENRAPMRWDLVESGNEILSWHRLLLSLHQQHPALRYGDFRRIESEHLFAFLRRTGKVRESLVVVANPGDRPVKEFLALREGLFQDLTPMRDLLGSSIRPTVLAGCLEVEVPAHQTLILQPDTSAYPKGYDRYDRMP